MGNLKTAAQALAQSILAGPWTYDAVQDRARRALGGGPPAPDALAERLLQRLGDHHVLKLETMMTFLKFWILYVHAY